VGTCSTDRDDRRARASHRYLAVEDMLTCQLTVTTGSLPNNLSREIEKHTYIYYMNTISENVAQFMMANLQTV